MAGTQYPPPQPGQPAYPPPGQYPPGQPPPQYPPPPAYGQQFPQQAQQPYGHGGNTGPIGAQKNILKQFLLALVTIGIYGVYWAYRNHEDIKEHSGQGVGGAVGAVIYVLVGIVTAFLLPSEIQKMYERDGQKSPVSATTGFWILLFGIPWYVKCQAALNQYWASKGAPPAA
jgi:uncharacterized protein DUF4234